MASDLLTIRLRAEHSSFTPPNSVTLLQPEHFDDLAHAYLAAYPPGVAAANLDEARQEMQDTLAGEYGRLRSDASWAATLDRRAVGCIMVVERSIWDPEVSGPFVIELFVHPEAAGSGLGRALVLSAMSACFLAGDASMTLRVGEGTSPAAHRLYRGLGFHPPFEATTASSS